MKLLLLTDELEVGGSQRQMLAIACGLTAMGFEVQVAYFLNASYFVDRLNDCGVKVTCIPKARGFDPRFFVSLCRFLWRERFDIVHAFSLSAEFWGAVTHMIAGRGVFFSSIRNRYDWYSQVQWRAKAFISRRSAAVVANSETGGDYAVERGGVPRTKLRVLHNGIDTAQFAGLNRDAARATLGLSSTQPVVMHVGRLVEQKNLPCLLRSIALVNARAHARCKLALVGSGPLRESLEKLAASLNIAGDIAWLGERSDVPMCLAAADIAVQASHFEGLSNSLLEAMAGSLPIVATAVGGTPEIVTDGATGFLVPRNDHVTFAERIERLLRTPDLAASFGKAARARIDADFSVQSMLQKLRGIYAEFVEEVS